MLWYCLLLLEDSGQLTTTIVRQLRTEGLLYCLLSPSSPHSTTILLYDYDCLNEKKYISNHTEDLF